MAPRFFDWLRQRWAGLLVGAAATAALCAVYATGSLRELDNAVLDWSFRHFSSVPADERITLIDIDDASLAEIGEWPWPRRRFAEIVNILHELGASSIALDLIFAEPAPPRLANSEFHRKNYDSGTPQDVGLPGAPIVVNAADIAYDDDELAAAIARAGSVILSTYMRVPNANSNPEKQDAPRTDFRAEAWSFLASRPNGDWPEFFHSIFPEADITAISPQREDLLTGFRWARAARTVRAASRANPFNFLTCPAHELAKPAAVPLDMEPPLDKLAVVAAGFGFVQFQREGSRGIVRGLRLANDVGGVCVPQLGLAAVSRLRHGQLLFGQPVINGEPALIHWHVPASGRWQDSFRHIPAARVLEIADRRAAITANARLFAVALSELVRARHADTPAEFDQYARRINEGLLVHDQLTRVALPEPRREMLDRLADLDRDIRAAHDDALLWLDHAAGLWADQEPQDELERAERDRVLQWHDRFSQGRMKAHLAELNAQLERDANELLTELRPQIAGRLCIVGYTATGTADLVATPVFDSLPGVMVHANVANTILHGSFPMRAPHGINLLMIAACGLLMAAAGNIRGVRFGSLAMIALSSASVIAGAWLFRSHSIHISSAAAIASIVSTWAAVTIIRQSTEERVRRRLERALTQYVSPEIAGRIARRVRPRDMAPQRATVTCFFSDLGEFTRLSERLGPEATRRVLNPYLEAVSRVLITHGAIVNKFMGDGVFAFFNAPIRPCLLHAQSACQAAAKVLEAVAELNRPRPAADGNTMGLLQVRVGISTGDVFVGDYGSEAKLDYTCIGDAVNVAARLEKANKTFGTQVMLDDATRRGAGASFSFRSMGRLLLPGKESAVSAHELIASGPDIAGTGTPVDLHANAAFIMSFEQMLETFQHGEWDACREAFAACDRLRVGDVALERYRLAMLVASSGPTPPDWSGAIATGSA